MDSVRQATVDFALAPLGPDKSMAPVLAISEMVARGNDIDVDSTPFGESLQAFVTGPDWVPKSLGRRTGMPANKELWRNRKERKEWARGLAVRGPPRLEVVHGQAAAIDVGNGAHYVAV